MDSKEDAKRRSRRRHGSDLKRQVLAECAAPGASVAKVAMALGLNANLVHKWRRAVAPASRCEAEFVPVTVAAPAIVSETQQHTDAGSDSRPDHAAPASPART